MTPPSGYTLSPLLVLITALAGFEVCARLPFVLYSMAHPETGANMQVNFFSLYDPATVIGLGLSLVVMVVVMAALAGLISGFGVQDAARTVGLPRIPASVYIVALPFLIAAPLAIAFLGVDALIEDISGKRSEVGDQPVMWLLLKVAFFCHVIACLFYIRMVQTGRMIDRIAFGVTVLAVAATAVVFSQRAVLIALVVEVLYLQILLGRFSLPRALKIAATIFPLLLMISILRPASADLSFGEALMMGGEKILTSRYFLDFTKLGTVTLWAQETRWLGPVALGFLFEPFMGDGVVFYKELGPMIGAEVYLIREASGVTPGFVLEMILSFGIVLGLLGFGLITAVLLRLERRLLTNRARGLFTPIFLMLTVSKFTLLINSSLGAFCFLMIIEGLLLASTIYAMALLSWIGARLSATTSRAPPAVMSTTNPGAGS